MNSWPRITQSVLGMLVVTFVSWEAKPARGDDLGLKLPQGFRVTVYADETLANDTYAMTLDAKGRVVVTTQGAIKTLHDTDGDGRADKATLFATTPTGGMGLCFDGSDLMFCGDNWLSRYRDRDGDGQADGPPEHLVPLRFTEHGGHAMRLGPDGWWYAIGGNDSVIDSRHATLPHSPIKHPEAGALLRLPHDGPGCEIIAQGFRNPYDFDFNAVGDVFTYDSDVERDYFLPWYSPTRIYHVGYGGHHGWRVTGYMRCWARPPYTLDTVDMLWPIGRGSPTGVTCYRHTQLPEHYRGGVFALDWTFGKIWFLPLTPEGASYRTNAEVFLEPVGTQGFDPTDIVVAPDGSLLISIGGRRTRGSVYRVEYVGEGQRPVAAARAPADDLDAVLQAPQPLDAWSRAIWMPKAKRLGAERYAGAVLDAKRDVLERVRAVEVLTELFGGLPGETAKEAAGESSAAVRARVAWSLGRVSAEDPTQILIGLTSDADPRVRVFALDALADRFADRANRELVRSLVESFAHSDKRVRQAAARLAGLLPEESWKALRAEAAKAPLQAQLTAALAEVWRGQGKHDADAVAGVAIQVLGETNDPALRLQALRMIALALGDYHLFDPPVEIASGYSLQPGVKYSKETVHRALDAVRAIFPSDDALCNVESARVLAMLGASDPELPARLDEQITEKSSASLDLHYLVVLALVKSQVERALVPKLAHDLLALHVKLQGQELRNKQVWGERLAEVVAGIMARQPALASALLGDPLFASPSHVPLALRFEPKNRQRAARLMLAAAKRDDEFAWSGPLVDLVAELPADEMREALRPQWSNLGLRDAIAPLLAREPEEADRERLLEGLESGLPQVTAACLDGLDRLPRDESPAHLVPLYRLLRRLTGEPRERELRAHTLTTLERQLGKDLKVSEPDGGAGAIRQAYQPVFDAFARQHPDLALALEGAAAADLAAWQATYNAVDWSRGHATRGAAIFRDRACQTCHASASRIGPDLTGVATRFSRADLFAAIVAPSREVAPAYRTTTIATKDGQIHSGIAVFESADGVILQTGATVTMRIADADIAERQPSLRSIMPDGLLKDLSPRDLADLYRYLQTLTPPKPSATAR